MLSFHNNPAIKDKYLNRLKEHARLDNIVQRIGWDNSKGCAVGCTLENYDHKQYEIELGIPAWLAKLEDRLFEEMPNKEAKKFPVKFLEAIPVGVDLEQVKAPFLIYLMEFVLNCFDNDQFSDVTKAAKEVIDLYQSGETDVDKYEYEKAAYAAYASAAAAAYVDSDAAKAAAYSAYTAAYAAYTAYTAANAADAAAYAAAYAAASYAAYSSAYASSYAYDSYAYVYHEYRKEAAIKFSNKLIKLLKECK